MKLNLNVEFTTIHSIKSGEIFIPEGEWRYVSEDISDAIYHIYMRITVPNNTSGTIYYVDLSNGDLSSCDKSHGFNVVPLKDISLNCNFNF